MYFTPGNLREIYENARETFRALWFSTTESRGRSKSITRRRYRESVSRAKQRDFAFIPTLRISPDNISRHASHGRVVVYGWFLDEMALFHRPYAARKKRYPKSQVHPSGFIVMVTVIAPSIHPPGMKCYSTLFYLVPHCPLSHESSEIFHVRDESISLHSPWFFLLVLFSFRMTNNVMRFIVLRELSQLSRGKIQICRTRNAYDLLIEKCSY